MPTPTLVIDAVPAAPQLPVDSVAADRMLQAFLRLHGATMLAEFDGAMGSPGEQARWLAFWAKQWGMWAESFWK
jgi:hypothetical protein